MTVISKFNAVLLACSLMSLTPAALYADPTRPEAQLNLDVTATPVAAAPVLPKLSMIRSQGSRHLALLDGQWRKVGEKFGGYQVRSISVSQVTLLQGERRLVLSLFQTTTTTK